MRGTYKILLDGEVVYEVENLITTAGRKYILRYLAGFVPNLADSIAVGTGATDANVADTALNFEFSRAKITLKSVDVALGRVTYKGSLNPNDGGTIYEVGLYPAQTNTLAGQFGTRMLTSFETGTESWTNGTLNTTNFRIGAESIQATATTSSTTTLSNQAVGFDLSGYSNSDTFSLAYFTNDANAATIKVRLKTDNSNYYEYSFSPPATTSYNVKSFNKTNFVPTGAPSWANISSIDILVTAGAGGATTVQFDGFQIIDTDFYENYVLISRAVLSTPKSKQAGEQMDIEYTLEFTI